MAKPPREKRPSQDRAAETPDVEKHDEIYFRHPSGPKAGKVLSRGKTGCWVDAGGERHQMRWEHFLGHKTRVKADVKVIDQGEDGLLVEHAHGGRRYIHDPQGIIEPDESKPMAKSIRPAVLLMGDYETLAKAMGKPLKNRPGLALQVVTDNAGHQTKRWKKSGAEAPGGKAAVGQHNVEQGHHVKFQAGDFHGEGHVVGMPGAHGAHVRDKSGRQHQVHYGEITHHQGRDVTKAEGKGGGGGGGGGSDGGGFKAHDWAAQFDDPDLTAESVLAQFDESVAKAVAAAAERVKSITQSVDLYKEGDTYTEERNKVHREIFAEYLSDEKRAKATPADGEDPRFILLGGRGGSGKSKLEGLVYDADEFIKIDPDEIKSRLPEYQGWNAHEVHEESSDIAELIIRQARALGLNVVLDGTMKKAENALMRVEQFEEAGYRLEAHYMHLPRPEAAKRALSRFMTKNNDGSGRFVPLDVLLTNTTNEATFDAVSQRVHAWSFYDNQGEKDDPPKLIAKSK